MSLQEVRILADNRSFAWHRGDCPEDLRHAIDFLQSFIDAQASAAAKALDASKPIPTNDNPAFIFEEPK